MFYIVVTPSLKIISPEIIKYWGKDDDLGGFVTKMVKNNYFYQITQICDHYNFEKWFL